MLQSGRMQYSNNAGFSGSQYHAQQQPSSYSSAPYRQSGPAPADNHTPPTKYPMAAPPAPLTPASNQQMNTSNAAPSPTSPPSPESQAREQERINLLFDINVELLQEVNKLQAEGKGGAISPQQVQQLKAQGQPAPLASDEYIQCLRRVQANLAYLMPKAQPDQAQGKVAQGPAHMTPPPHMPQLQTKYDRLKDIFPGWAGMDARLAASSASPKPQVPAGNGMAGQAVPLPS